MGIEYKDLPNSLLVDDILLLDDGKMRLRVDSVSATVATVADTLSTRRRIFPSSNSNMSSTSRLFGRSLYSIPTQELSPSSAS